LLDFKNHKGLKRLLVPGALILGAAAAVIQTGALNGSASAVDLGYYAAFAIGLLLAWRFHSSRIFSALIVLLLAQRAVEFFAKGRPPIAGPGLTALEAVSFLVPINFALIALGRERGFNFITVVPRLALLFAESVFVAVICRPYPAPGSALFHGALLRRTWFSWTGIPQISWLAFVAVGVLLVVRALSLRKQLESGFLWGLLSFFLALNVGELGVAARAYGATAAIILAVSIIETSYAMAYHDELTGVPSRRAFNEATLRLEAPFTIAAVDIDHFKSVNDTYGHESGDDVLCMVAVKLARVTGGGQAYRVGGEEFSILFPSRSAREVLGDLENLRLEIEQSSFRLREGERRTAPRGPDRRTTAQRKKNAHSKARSGMQTSRGELRITVSIGIAEADARHATAESVMNLADKALYRAKQAGRNRIELAAGTRTRKKKKSTENIA